MTTPTDPDPLHPSRLPPGISEDDLLAYVEGELDPEAENRVLVSLSSRSAALSELNAMRMDRLAVEASSRIDAPASVIEFATQAVERQTPTDDEPPGPRAGVSGSGVPLVRPLREPPGALRALSSLLRSDVLLRVAPAVVVVVAIGVVWQIMATRPPTPRIVEPVDAAVDDPPAVIDDADAGVADARDQQSVAALEPTQVEALAGREAIATTPVDDAPAAPDPASPGADNLADDERLAYAAVLRLAREGRVYVRVTLTSAAAWPRVSDEYTAFVDERNPARSPWVLTGDGADRVPSRVATLAPGVEPTVPGTLASYVALVDDRTVAAASLIHHLRLRSSPEVQAAIGRETLTARFVVTPAAILINDADGTPVLMPPPRGRVERVAIPVLVEAVPGPSEP